MNGEHPTNVLERPPEREAYAMGYSDIFLKLLRRRSAGRNAAHLMPLLRPGMDLLDLGCGPGSITLGLAQAVWPGEVTGLDQNPEQAGGSKERIFESTLVILTPKRPKSNKKSASASPKVKKPKPRVEPTPAEVEAREQNRHEYELKRAERPERKEHKRRHAQAKRQEAKSLGLCIACGAPHIPDQMRCETCAEQHRVGRQRWYAERKAKERASQQREQASGQA